MPINYDNEYPQLQKQCRKLKAEIKRLRDAIVDAPHDSWCMHFAQIKDSECSSDCWKAALKEQDLNETRRANREEVPKKS